MKRRRTHREGAGLSDDDFLTRPAHERMRHFLEEVFTNTKPAGFPNIHLVDIMYGWLNRQCWGQEELAAEALEDLYFKAESYRQIYGDVYAGLSTPLYWLTVLQRKWIDRLRARGHRVEASLDEIDQRKDDEGEPGQPAGWLDANQDRLRWVSILGEVPTPEEWLAQQLEASRARRELGERSAAVIQPILEYALANLRESSIWALVGCTYIAARAGLPLTCGTDPERFAQYVVAPTPTFIAFGYPYAEPEIYTHIGSDSVRRAHPRAAGRLTRWQSTAVEEMCLTIRRHRSLFINHVTASLSGSGDATGLRAGSPAEAKTSDPTAEVAANKDILRWTVRWLAGAGLKEP